jgi:hypothetical protein
VCLSSILSFPREDSLRLKTLQPSSALGNTDVKFSVIVLTMRLAEDVLTSKALHGLTLLVFLPEPVDWTCFANHPNAKPWSAEVTHGFIFLSVVLSMTFCTLSKHFDTRGKRNPRNLNCLVFQSKNKTGYSDHRKILKTMTSEATKALNLLC